MLLGQQRTPYREIFFSVWQKVLSAKSGEPPILDPMEEIIATLISQHPEYHAIFAAPEQHANTEFPTNNLYENPFLHISMHLSLVEQLHCDRPKGIQACYQNLLLKTCDEHQLQHQVMDIIAAHIWDSINNNREVNDQSLLESIKKLN